MPASDIGEPIETSTKDSFDANCSGVARGVEYHKSSSPSANVETTDDDSSSLAECSLKNVYL